MVKTGLILLCIFYTTVYVNCDFPRIMLHKLSSVENNLDVNEEEEETFSVMLSTFSNIFYYVDISFPSQSFSLIVTTRSPTFWVPSDKCKTCWGTKYNPNVSSKYKPGKIVTNQENKVIGILSSDFAMIGQVGVEDVYFLQAYEDFGYHDDAEYDGVLGLGYSDDTSFSKYLLDDYVKRGVFDKRIFSFYFNLHNSSKIGTHMRLGDSDSDLYKGHFTYLPVTSNSTWEIKMDRINVDNKTLCANGCRVVFDVGMVLILGPKQETTEINEAIGHSVDDTVDYFVDCNSTASLPDIHFILGGKTFTLTGEDYILEIHFRHTRKCVSSFSDTSISPPPEGVQWILGTTFLNKFYSEFDLDQNRIGLAESVF